VNGGPEKAYRTGDNWTELPGDHHAISANASQARPAKVLAVFVVVDGDQVLTTPDSRRDPAGAAPSCRPAALNGRCFFLSVETTRPQDQGGALVGGGE
jgi:hypothetical protein